MSDLVTLVWMFFRLSFLCVGGGMSSIPEMQRLAVSVHGWVTARQFVDGYALSQITPGPAMLVVIFIGYRVAGVLGAFLSMLAMFLPTSLLTLAFAHYWSQLRTRPWPLAVERALPPVAIGLIAAGVYTVGRSAVTDVPTAILAAAAALVLFKRWVPVAIIIVLAGVAGWGLGM